MAVRLPRDAGVAKANVKRLTPVGLEANAFIERRGTAREPLHGVAKDVGRSSNIVQKTCSPQINILPKMEAQEPVVERIR